MITNSAPTIAWHRTREDLLAAQCGTLSCLALPAPEGGFRIAIAYDLDTPPRQWTAADFLPLGVLAKDEADLRKQVEALASQHQEAESFQRREIEPRTPTPWGEAQYSERYAEGIVFHSTARHGGFHLDPARNALVHPDYRDEDGWYEEDEQWAKVAATFPLLFTGSERRAADEALRDREPDAYERVNGITLAPGESYMKDKHLFLLEHAADWLVISAINSTYRPGFNECLAALGGNRDTQDYRRFLVPEDEYEEGYFVIDESRHEAYSGPSDFPELAPAQEAAQQSMPEPEMPRSDAAAPILADLSEPIPMGQVLNKHKAGIPEGAVYIGRGSKWGNPFRIGQDGNRDEVIAKHENWLRGQHHLLRSLDELRGHDLVCFCAPQRCHGDLLLRLANSSREERVAWWRGENTPDRAPKPASEGVREDAAADAPAPVHQLTPAEERDAMRRLSLPDYAANHHGYTLEWRDEAHTSAILTRDGEQLHAARRMNGVWSYESRTGDDRGDILDFEIHRGARTLRNAHAAVRRELTQAKPDEQQFDPALAPSSPERPDGPDLDGPEGQRPDLGRRPRRGR